MPRNDKKSERRRSRRGFLKAATLGSAAAVPRPSTLVGQEPSRRSLGTGVGAYGDRSGFEAAMRRVSDATLPAIEMPNRDGFVPDARPDLGAPGSSRP